MRNLFDIRQKKRRRHAGKENDMNMPVNTILLAGGASKRMMTEKQKVLHVLCGKPMLDWVMEAAAGLRGYEQAGQPVAVVGFGMEQVKTTYQSRLRYVEQKQQRGSGSALLAAREELRQAKGRALVLAGDLPLLKKETLQKLAGQAGSAALLTAEVENPAGYARVFRYKEGNLLSVVEEENLSAEQYACKEVRVSAYCFDIPALLQVLDTIAAAGENNECSMSDILNAFIAAGEAVETVTTTPEEAMGVNDRVQLAACTKVLQRRINAKHMLAGVTMIDPEATYIEASVKLGKDCTLYPGVVLMGNTVIEEGCVLYPACRITDSHFGRYVEAQGVIARDAVVGNGVTLGPFVNLRPGTRLGDMVKVGDFVEIKNSAVGEGSKLPHLSYIGDGDVGKRVNLGCGTVFVNYDGYKKHRTKVGDGAFIGCNTSLVAPVEVGKNAFTAAGSVITEDVPDETLALARARQVNKVGYMSKLRVKRGEKQP